MLICFSLEVLYRKKKNDKLLFQHSYLLFPWVLPERGAVPTGHSMYSGMRHVFLSFLCSFHNTPLTHPYSSLMPSFISCFDFTSCCCIHFPQALTFHCYIIPELSSLCLHPHITSQHPEACISPTQRPLQLPGHPAPCPTTSFRQ